MIREPWMQKEKKGNGESRMKRNGEYGRSWGVCIHMYVHRGNGRVEDLIKKIKYD